MKFSIKGIQVNIIERLKSGKKFQTECSCQQYISNISRYSKGKVLVHIQEKKTIKKIIRSLKTILDSENIISSQFENLKSISLFVKDESKVIDILKKEFKIINAGGGAIFKGENLLFIFRLGKWDLPKGKMDKGESFEQTAVREVEEETGLKVKLIEPLMESFHTYKRKKRYFLKQTKWYRMSCIDDKGLSPQVEEGIEAVEWIPPKKWDEKLENSYKTIRKVIKEIRKIEKN